MRIRRTFKWLVAWAIAAAILAATGPTIWRDALANIQTYLHLSRNVAMAIVVVPVGLILLTVSFIRLRNWVSVQRRHRAVHEDALRNLRL